jgi:hypothetical protein
MLHDANIRRHFFPSTEAGTKAAADEEWENVKGEESAENGAPNFNEEHVDTEEEPRKVEAEETASKLDAEEISSKVELPDAPTAEPNDERPAAKKQKSEDGERL